MDKITLTVISSKFGYWASHKHTASHKYRVTIGRSVLEPVTEYASRCAALKAGRRIVNNLGYTKMVERGLVEEWSK